MKNVFSHCPRILAGLNRLMATQTNMTVEQTIRQKLQETFQPKFLEVINESYMHNVPKGSETHFKVVVVSEKFDSQPMIKRHRMVNEVLKDELSSGVHALSIMTKTPQQWNESGNNIGKSPPCRGGAGL
ncbi:hypothetical protein ACJMK2_035560 [Sinanodonta woodiana]|uniref:BolA-like protein DDB_G0274169 n=1 Tax=Sinanodonta woodiana TaxID=1069815 RepID=A0ABD3WVC5_SINWO